MPIRSLPVGNSVASFNAIAGTPVQVALTTAATGTTLGSFIAPSDLVIVTANDSASNAITLPDPAKYGLTPGDSFLIINGSTTAIVVFPHNASSLVGNAASKTQISNGGCFYILGNYVASTTVASWFRVNTLGA